MSSLTKTRSWLAADGAPDPAEETELFSGLLIARTQAFLFDAAFYLGLLAGGWLILTLTVWEAERYNLLARELWLYWAPAALLLYFGVSIGWFRATPGMSRMGLQAEKIGGGRPGIVRASFHSIVFYLTDLLLGPFVLLFPVLDRRKRFLHDMAARMVVLRKPGVAA